MAIVTCKEAWITGKTDLDLEFEEVGADLGGEGKRRGEERERESRSCWWRPLLSGGRVSRVGGVAISKWIVVNAESQSFVMWGLFVRLECVLFCGKKHVSETTSLEWNDVVLIHVVVFEFLYPRLDVWYKCTTPFHWSFLRGSWWLTYPTHQHNNLFLCFMIYKNKMASK